MTKHCETVPKVAFSPAKLARRFFLAADRKTATPEADEIHARGLPSGHRFVVPGRWGWLDRGGRVVEKTVQGFWAGGARGAAKVVPGKMAGKGKML